jgi:hypothetical protein
MAVVPHAAREEAELAVHVPADARRRPGDAVRIRGVRVDEHDLGRERGPVHQIRIGELALGVDDHVEGVRPRARHRQERDGHEERQKTAVGRHGDFSYLPAFVSA